MSSSPALLRFVVGALIAATSSPAPDPGQIAAAYDARCVELRRRLQPLFGTQAVAALFARALHMAAAEYPWLAEAIPKDHERCSPEGLERIPGGLDPAVMAAGLASVLANQISLLAMLIGDDLVLPLVQEAWAETTPSDAARSNDDHD